jgi:hypothetical protein
MKFTQITLKGLVPISQKTSCLLVIKDITWLVMYKLKNKEHAEGKLVEALCYKPEGRGIESQ